MFSSITPAKLVHSLKRFVKNVRGNTSFTFAIAAIPIVAAAGSAIDIQRESMTRTTLQAAVDSATLYAATLGVTNNDLLTTNSKPYFELPDIHWENNVTVKSFSMVDNGTYVTGTAEVIQKNWFMGLMGKSTIDIKAKAEVQKSGSNIEVSLVLDNTGSMNTGDAIGKLRVAAKKFVNSVMPDSQADLPFYTKIAIVPYNNGVNLGPTLAVSARGAVPSGTSNLPGFTNQTYTSQWNQPQTATITSCVTERQGTAAYTDQSATTYPVGLAYDPPNGWTCNDSTVKQLMPLSRDKTALTNHIDGMAAKNTTAGQVGIAWGWYTLSPNIGLFTGDAKPAGYDKLTATIPTERVKKVMALLTDAEYNTAYCNGIWSYPSSLPVVQDPDSMTNCSSPLGNAFVQAKSMCDAIRASGVELYVITFQLDKTKTERVKLVNDCADKAHQIDGDSTSLDVAFQSLANKVMALRLAK